MYVITYYYLLVTSSLLLESYAGKYYTSRQHLNETVYSKTRHVVHNFIDKHRMNLLDHFIKLRKSDFDISAFGRNNYFTLRQGLQRKVTLDGDGLFRIPSHPTQTNTTEFIEKELKASGCFERFCETPLETAISILKRLSYISMYKDLLLQFENVLHVQENIFAYASEIYHTNITFACDGITYYYFPPKPSLEIIVNGREYVFNPHTDSHPLIFDRPLAWNMEKPRPCDYRVYTAVLFFTDLPHGTGGQFEWYDFPNNYKLPPAKAKQLPGKGTHVIYSPAFDDPDLKITTIQPERAKLLLFHAEDDIHASRKYIGDVERWAFVMKLATTETKHMQINHIEPTYVTTKTAPLLHTTVPR